MVIVPKPSWDSLESPLLLLWSRFLGRLIGCCELVCLGAAEWASRVSDPS